MYLYASFNNWLCLQSEPEVDKSTPAVHYFSPQLEHISSVILYRVPHCEQN